MTELSSDLSDDELYRSFSYIPLVVDVKDVNVNTSSRCQQTLTVPVKRRVTNSTNEITVAEQHRHNNLLVVDYLGQLLLSVIALSAAALATVTVLSLW